MADADEKSNRVILIRRDKQYTLPRSPLAAHLPLLKEVATKKLAASLDDRRSVLRLMLALGKWAMPLEPVLCGTVYFVPSHLLEVGEAAE